MEPSSNLQENICSKHDEVMKMFCRTDQKSICYLCSVDEHKGHDTVSAAAERTERQRELEERRGNIQQRIQDREKDVKLLQQEVEAINHSAEKTVEDSEKIFTELIRLLQKRSSDVKQQIRSQQETEVSPVKDVQEKLKREISELKRKDAELEQLSHTEDHNQFLLNYPSLPALRESTLSSSINIRPLRHFEDVTAAVSELRDKLQDALRDSWRKISLITGMDVLLSEPEPKSRAEFLTYSCEITLDPNTAHRDLVVSEDNTKVTHTNGNQVCHENNSEIFNGWTQVLSIDSLPERCYWEVEWTGNDIEVAVAYKSIKRGSRDNECGFGRNNKSWSLHCCKDRYTIWHNNKIICISRSDATRIGVYLDQRAGILSFFRQNTRVSESMTFLLTVQTTFTEPLHAGVRLYFFEDMAKFCKPTF